MEQCTEPGEVMDWGQIIQKKKGEHADLRYDELCDKSEVATG